MPRVRIDDVLENEAEREARQPQAGHQGFDVEAEGDEAEDHHRQLAERARSWTKAGSSPALALPCSCTYVVGQEP